MTRNEIIARDIINQMFIIAGHQVSYDDIIGRKDAWYTQWTMTEDQRQEWIQWGIKYLKRKAIIKR